MDITKVFMVSTEVTALLTLGRSTRHSIKDFHCIILIMGLARSKRSVLNMISRCSAYVKFVLLSSMV